MLKPNIKTMDPLHMILRQPLSEKPRLTILRTQNSLLKAKLPIINLLFQPLVSNIATLMLISMLNQIFQLEIPLILGSFIDMLLIPHSVGKLSKHLTSRTLHIDLYGQAKSPMLELIMLYITKLDKLVDLEVDPLSKGLINITLEPPMEIRLLLVTSIGMDKNLSQHSVFN